MPNVEVIEEFRENTHKTGRTELANQITGKRLHWPNPRSSWRDEVESSYLAYQKDVSATVAREVDVAAILRYFDLQELQARVFDEILQLEVLTNTSDTGAVSSHPHLAMFCRLIQTGIKLANEIGATPASRVRLGLNLADAARATAALDAAINANADQPVDVEIVDGEVVMRW